MQEAQTAFIVAMTDFVIVVGFCLAALTALVWIVVIYKVFFD